MSQNKGIKLITGVVVLVVILLVVSGGKSQTDDPSTKSDINNVNQAIASQFNDNIRDVSARLIEDEKKSTRLAEDNKLLKAKLDSLLAMKEQGGVVVREDSSELKASVEALKTELAQVKAQQTSTPSANDYAVNGGNRVENGSLLPRIKDIDALLVERKLTDNERLYWKKLAERKQAVVKKRPAQPVSIEKAPAIPYYTIPAGADLGNTVLLSALIGQVPVEGKLMQPLFPFSALISRGDLMASNGVPLPPDVSGMKVNGYAIGVGSFLDDISCVRAYVTSVLFTFQDGHFVVVGNEQMKNSAELVNNDSLGYLTTPFGNPCIHGKYFTNAPRVLTAMMAAGGVQGAGNALSQWQMSYFAGANGGAAIPTGSFGKYAAGEAVAGGSVKAADWLEKRIQGSFDMVFVPASLKCRQGNRVRWCANHVSLHLTKTISIDKEPLGRMIHYGRQQQYSRDFSLR
ncbi:TIGR03752 family integrating conjugative element protein [Legionella fairfieldensis]|uniref:TIGR03752 family integrating conjugative element protein n=1 Tax=Legionella fairfieldensis TaxID=45064 RepID=UPI000490871D|nr:TIGR03752 family integrating conjugative element protein [Legionella fairfieldensis]